jgi:hypothetical protein
VSTTKQDARSREDEKAELRRILEAPSEKALAAARLAEIEREEAEQREQRGRKAATERQKAIARSAGSLVTELGEDVRKLNEAAAAYREAAAQVNLRHARIQSLADEANALADRFEGVRPAKLPVVVAPDRTEGVVAAARIVDAVTFSQGKPTFPATEQCEHAMRRRRNYAEVAGTPAFEIITEAGLRPFEPLNETQQRMVADRLRQDGEGDRGLKEIAPFAQRTVAESTLSGSLFR